MLAGCRGFGIQMLSSLTDAWRWPARIRPRPVVLSSSHPPGECLRRLATVTTRRGATSWHLDPQNAGRPAPRLRGDVGPSRIFVARFQDASGRNSFAPWLDARPEPAAGGGTALTGKIGLHPNVAWLIPVMAGFFGLAALAGPAGGIALLIHGELRGLPLVLVPLALATLMVGINVAGLRSLERNIPRLIQEMNGVLGSALPSQVRPPERECQASSEATAQRTVRRICRYGYPPWLSRRAGPG